MRTSRAAVVGTVLALALVPAAQGHTSYVTPDDQYRIVVGNLGEPVYTFVKTGLDLCFQANTTERAPVTIDPFAFTATIIAPGNETMTQPLRAQFGRAGCYTFEEGYVLTQPGQYVLHLQGTIAGSAVDTRINVAGPIGDSADITFPDEAAPNGMALQDDIKDLQAAQNLAWAGMAILAVALVLAFVALRRKSP